MALGTVYVADDTPRAGAEPVFGYRLVQRLGSGGHGEVWRAEAPGGFQVALKFIRLGSEPTRTDLRSLEILREIRHPNLLLTFGAWEIPGFLVLGMELADRTLWDRFCEAQDEGLPGIPREELLEYLSETAKGIDHLNGARHTLDGRPRHGVQHRDLKPQNILLAGGGVKVADFGLARQLDHSLASHTGNHWTFAYAAPEFFRKQTASHSDQYSLAATYCHLRGGRTPFQGPAAVIMAGHLLFPPDLSMIPEEEHPIVGRALAKSPKDRWPSCRAFVQALREVVPMSAFISGPSPLAIDEEASGDGLPTAELPEGASAIGQDGDASAPLDADPWGTKPFFGSVLAADTWQPLSAEGGPPVLGSGEMTAEFPAFPAFPHPTSTPEPAADESIDDVWGPPPPMIEGDEDEEPWDPRDFEVRPSPRRRWLFAASSLAGAAAIVALVGLGLRASGPGEAEGSARRDVILGVQTTPAEGPPALLGRELQPTHLVLASRASDASQIPTTPEPPLEQARRTVEVKGPQTEVVEAEPTPRPQSDDPDLLPPAVAEPLRVEAPKTVAIRAGAEGAVEVKVNRSGRKGPIRLELAGAPEGVTLTPIEIPEGQDEARVGVAAGDQAVAGSRPARLVARVGDEEATADLTLVVEPAPKASSLTLKAPDSLKIEAGRPASLSFRVDRGGVVGPIAARVEGLPPGVIAPDRTLSPGETSAVIVVSVPADSPSREYEARLVATADDVRAEASLKVAVVPSQTSTLLRKARTTLARGGRDEALAILDEALKLNPEDAAAYALRGSIHIKASEFERAIADFGEALKRRPHDATSYNNRGLARRGLGEYHRAIADYDEALRLNPNDAVVHFNRGMAYHHLGDDRGAIADFSKAIELDPRHAPSYRSRGETLARLGEEKKARADLNEAQRLEAKSSSRVPVGGKPTGRPSPKRSTAGAGRAVVASRPE